MKYLSIVLLSLIGFVPMKEDVSLMIVAHPDDEILWGGEQLRTQKYVVVCMTNGDHLIRSKEFARVMRRCGDEGIMYHYPDKVNGKRSNWKAEEKAMRYDLQKLITSRNWKQIVTHNPDGEYGHEHHKMLSHFVTQITENIDYENLYYFNHYYRKKEITNYLPTIPFSGIKWKEEMMRLYFSQKVVNDHLKHMYSYEVLIPKKDWKHPSSI